MTDEPDPEAPEDEPMSDVLDPPPEPFSAGADHGREGDAGCAAGKIASPLLLNASTAEFTWKTHDYVNAYIRFADTKAGVVIVFCSGLMAALYAAKVHIAILNTAPGVWGSIQVIGCFAWVVLVFAAVCAALVVLPRLTSQQPQGFIFWQSILAFKSADGFCQAYGARREAQLAEHLARHLYDLASVADRKYFWVGLSVWSALGGSILAATAILLKDVLA